MSFWPLATSLVDSLRARSAERPLIELGCGRGEFTRRLRQAGLDPIALDLERVAATPRVCADLRRLPFRAGSAGAFVAGNLWRHLDAATRSRLGDEAARAAGPGAYLLFFEDAPEPRDEAEANYRRCLELLAEFDPRRGVACSVLEERELLRASWGEVQRHELHDNDERVHEAELPLRWIVSDPSCSAALRVRCEELLQRVRRFGMSYGRYELTLFVRPA